MRFRILIVILYYGICSRKIANRLNELKYRTHTINIHISLVARVQMMPSICTSKQYRWYIIDYKTTQISQEILLEMHSVHHMKVELQFCSSSFEWDCSAEAEDMKLFLFHGAASLHNDTPWSLPDSMTFLLSFLSCCIWLDDFIIDMNSLPKRCSSARSCGLTKDLQNKIYIFFILFIYFFWHSLHSDSFQSSCLARITQGKKGIKKKKKSI